MPSNHEDAIKQARKNEEVEMAHARERYEAWISSFKRVMENNPLVFEMPSDDFDEMYENNPAIHIEVKLKKSGTNLIVDQAAPNQWSIIIPKGATKEELAGLRNAILDTFEPQEKIVVCFSENTPPEEIRALFQDAKAKNLEIVAFIGKREDFEQFTKDHNNTSWKNDAERDASWAKVMEKITNSSGGKRAEKILQEIEPANQSTPNSAARTYPSNH